MSAAAATQCTACPVGSLPNAKSSLCSICDLGFFKSDPSCATSCCSSCPLHSYSALTDAIACTACTPSTWLSHSEPCIVNACANGFINSTRSRSCEACPAGHWQLGNIISTPENVQLSSIQINASYQVTNVCLALPGLSHPLTQAHVYRAPPAHIHPARRRRAIPARFVTF